MREVLTDTEIVDALCREMNTSRERIIPVVQKQHDQVTQMRKVCIETGVVAETDIRLHLFYKSKTVLRGGT